MAPAARMLHGRVIHSRAHGFKEGSPSCSSCFESLLLSLLLFSAALPAVFSAPSQPKAVTSASYQPTGLVRVYPTDGVFRDTYARSKYGIGTGANDTSTVSRAADLTLRLQRQQRRREGEHGNFHNPGNGPARKWTHNYGGSPGMSYHGGPVMSSPISAYIVFYGSWSRADRGAVTTFVQSISDDSGNPAGVASVRRWWRTTSLYAAKGRAVSSQVRLAKSVVDRYSQGKAIKNDMDGVWQVIRKQIDSGNFPVDAAGMYVVLTSADVRLGDPSQGFCGPRGYCGWHSSASNGRTDLKVIHVGNGGQQCPQYCVPSYNTRASPSSHPGVDGVINTLAHEMAETATNPLIDNGWFDISTLEEVADKCARVYGRKGKEVQLAKQGFSYNMFGKAGSRFLIQQIWSRASPQKCVLQGPA